jgi:hypothetical protein
VGTRIEGNRRAPRAARPRADMCKVMLFEKSPDIALVIVDAKALGGV